MTDIYHGEIVWLQQIEGASRNRATVRTPLEIGLILDLVVLVRNEYRIGDEVRLSVDCTQGTGSMK